MGNNFFNQEFLDILPDSEICELLKKYRTGDKNAYNTIIEHHFKLILIIIRKYFHTTEIEQEDLFESLGGGYTSDEIDEHLHNDDINFEISEKLKEQGVTKYLYENEEYLDEIREGRIICEGIDVDEIRKNLNQ